jgi:hypothetical protein
MASPITAEGEALVREWGGVMTGNITRLPPASRGQKPEMERDRWITANCNRLPPVWIIRKAGETLARMSDRWECEAYSESDREELDDVLDGLVSAEHDLNRRLANGAA